MRNERGMTLLEVLVALAVFAFAALALMKVIGEGVATLDHLQDKTIAHWVAQNRLALVQLEPEFPSTGTRQGKTDMAGRTWFWRAIVKSTADKELRRVEVEVRESEDSESPLETLVGFVGRSQQESKR